MTFRLNIWDQKVHKYPRERAGGANSIWGSSHLIRTVQKASHIQARASDRSFKCARSIHTTTPKSGCPFCYYGRVSYIFSGSRGTVVGQRPVVQKWEHLLVFWTKLKQTTLKVGKFALSQTRCSSKTFMCLFSAAGSIYKRRKGVWKYWGNVLWSMPRGWEKSLVIWKFWSRSLKPV